jgi:hypothetical protein
MGKNQAKCLEISAYSGKITCQVITHKNKSRGKKEKVTFQFYEATAPIAVKEKSQYHKTWFDF